MTTMQNPIEKIITNEPTENISIAWDGERFHIWRTLTRNNGIINAADVLLNPREAQEIANFINQQLPKEGSYNSRTGANIKWDKVD